MLKEYSNKRSSIFFQITLHLVVWAAFVSFPILLLPAESLNWDSLLLRHWIPLIFSALLFYVNYLYLINAFLFKSRILLFLIINVAIIILLLFGFEWIKDFFSQHPFNSSSHKPFKTFFYFRIFISYLLPVGVSVAIKSTQRFLNSEIERKNSENEALKSELNYLHYQIQPHFFFNSLNTIYALITEAPERAQKALHQLSKLMRYVLYETSENRVSLSQEIAFIQNYIQLMQERQGHIIKISADFPSNIEEIQIAPLLFIPLVENAFKHSVSSETDTFIDLKLALSNGELIFTISNSNNPKDVEDKSGSGIGIINLQKRLDNLYPQQNSLTIESKAGIYNSVLKIKL